MNAPPDRADVLSRIAVAAAAIGVDTPDVAIRPVPDLDWVSHVMHFATRDHLQPEYLELNPNGVVPTLVHDGEPIIESSVICEYLDDVFPEPPLSPSDALGKARLPTGVDQALHFAGIYVIATYAESRLEQVSGHPVAHGAETDESYVLGHDCSAIGSGFR